MNATPLQLKESLTSAKTFEDLNSVFVNTHFNLIEDMYHAINNSSAFIELTMRDEAILEAAQRFIDNRKRSSVQI